MTPRPGHTLTELETQVDSIIDAAQARRPDRRGAQAREGRLSSLRFLNGLQSNLGKAFQLAEDQTFYNDPSHTVRGRVREAAGGDRGRRQARREQVPRQGRVVLSNVPLGKSELASHADKSTVVTDPLTENTTEIKP